MEKEIIFNQWFKFRICSDLDYEGMVVDIVYKNSTFAILNQDKGIENTEIKLFPPITDECWNFSYNEFIETLEKAKKLLIQINKEKRDV